MFKIIEIKNNLTLLSEVLELHKINTTTLGFLPRAAFEKYGNDNQILLAVEDNVLLGYLLFSINSTSNLVYIVHLCVSQNYRKKGIASQLIEYLKSITQKSYRGIRVRCREDYEATKVWSRLNFINKNQIPGRSKTGSTLIVWWYDYDKEDLFSNKLENTSSKNIIKAVIDANVFFDFNESMLIESDSIALMSDWLLETTELYITPELRNEILRQKDIEFRKKSQERISDFQEVWFKQLDYVRILKRIKNIWNRESNDSNDSDIRQLAMTAAAKMNYFITADASILGNASMFLKEFGLSILSPSAFLLAQDYFSNKAIYSDVSLGGSSFNISRVSVDSFDKIIELFYDKNYEKKKKFSNSISKFLTDLVHNELLVISEQDDLYALICISKENNNLISIPIIRFIKRRYTAELQDYIIGLIINKAKLGDFKEIIFKDKFITNELCSKLEKYGFTNLNGTWIKYLLPSIMNLKELQRYRGYENQLDLQIAKIESNFSKPNCYLEEKKIWPTKLKDINIPCYIVPIKPEWALHLFDSALANQNLFGSLPHLIFNLENVYYKSAFNNKIMAPSRILWYVSRSKDIKGQIQCLKAASYCDKIIIDEPLKLFNKFKKYGIYQKSDINKLAIGKNQILAFIFSMTELFTNPIKLEDLKLIWKNELDVNFNPITTIKIPSSLYFKLYEKGNI